MKLVEGFDSNYRYILVAARRARNCKAARLRSSILDRASPAALLRMRSKRAG